MERFEKKNRKEQEPRYSKHRKAEALSDAPTEHELRESHIGLYLRSNDIVSNRDYTH